MFSIQLKESTAKEHAALEKQLVTRIKNIFSIAEYIQLLWLMHGYYHPIEKLLSPYTSHMAGIGDRRKSNHILRDIAFLQPGAEPSIRSCTQLPAVRSTASAMGVMYVLEGSTLGGQVITKMISRQLQLPDTDGFSFFNPYGVHTQQRWHDFKVLLEDSFSEEEKAAIVHAANETFSTFNQWVKQYEPAING
jgi:heme oxygenase (biliverdin-IX-beta and delta-forming)